MINTIFREGYAIMLINPEQWALGWGNEAIKNIVRFHIFPDKTLVWC